MKRPEALAWLRSLHPGAAVILSNGLTSRECAVYNDGPNNLYLLGAMGEALSVGIGLSHAIQRQVVVIEGDGGAVMGSAAWAHLPADNVEYYVLVNGIYETTGGQPVPLPEFEPMDVLTVDIEEGKAKTPNPPSPEFIVRRFREWLNG